MTKRPAFQWYPGDAQRDTALRACKLEARGLWREMMDLMHDGVPYGHLTAGGVPIDVETLAGMVGITPARCAALVSELEKRGVFSRNDAGVIYSRRMVKDEHNRTVRAKGGPKSLENENVPRPKDPAKDGGKDTFGASFGGSPATASASASSFAETPEQIADARIRFCAAANKGLAEHPHRPQSIPRILPNNGTSVQATEILLAAGMPVEFAESEIYRLAGSHTADDWITSLNYFVGGTSRAWQQHQAALDSNASRPRRSSARQQNPGAQQVANIKTFLTGTHD